MSPDRHWPTEPGGGYPRGAKSPGDDPVQLDIAVAAFMAYGQKRGLPRWAAAVDVFHDAWAFISFAVSFTGLAIMISLGPPREAYSGDALVRYPNAYAGDLAAMAAAGAFGLGLHFLPRAVFPWFQEAMMWRTYVGRKGGARWTVRALWRDQGALIFDPVRALRRDPLYLWLCALGVPLGIGLFGYAIRIQTLEWKDVEIIGRNGFVTTEFWTSQQTKHAFQDVAQVTLSCREESTGKNRSDWFANYDIALKNGGDITIKLRHPGRVAYLPLLAGIDARLRAEGVRFTFDAGYTRGCVLEFTGDEDLEFIRPFDQVMHFDEWRARNDPPETGAQP